MKKRPIVVGMRFRPGDRHLKKAGGMLACMLGDTHMLEVAARSPSDESLPFHPGGTSMSMEVTNCISIDVEGFVESNVESFPIPERYRDRNRENREIEENVDVFLELLDEAGARATFFFLGRIAEDLPHVVRRVAEQGHEIASHNHHHRRLTGLRPDEFREMARRSKEALEDASSIPVLGFRAPDFSITEESLWALDVLRETGFAYDSSIYPIRGHDVYGVPGAARNLHRHNNGLVEFPMACLDVAGARIPFGGGGYLRLYPLRVTFAMANRVNRLGEPCMFYIHPYEVGPNIPDIAEMSALRRFRHYHHCKDGRRRMRELLRRFRLAPAVEILRHLGWLQVED